MSFGGPEALGQPLSGVRVLSLAQQLPGPFAGQLLADLGADVVLVEQVVAGDPARRVAPLFESVNSGKRSISLDLKSESGAVVMKRLVRTSRIVLEGFRPGVAERLGIDFPTLRRERADLIYCSISGYGQDGPDRLLPGHDLSYQARAGAIDPEHFDRAAPQAPVADLSAAMYAALAVTAALLRPVPAYLDISLTEAALSFRAPQLAMQWANAGRGRARRHPGYGIFATRDGFISISVMHEDHFWRVLCTGLDLEDLAGIDSSARATRFNELRTRLAQRLRQRDTEELLVSLSARGVPVGRINDARSLLTDDLFRQRGVLTDAGDRIVVRSPLRRGVPADPAAPRLGADTRALLEELGFTEEEIAGMQRDGAVRLGGSGCR